MLIFSLIALENNIQNFSLKMLPTPSNEPANFSRVKANPWCYITKKTCQKTTVKKVGW